jgi:prefoldin alpha subunit
MTKEHKHTNACNHESELQHLGLQAQLMSQQLDKVDNSLMELEYIKNSIDELTKMKKGSDVLSPISNGIFVKTKLDDTSKLLVNVGKEVIVEKTVSETKALLDDRFAEVTKMREELVSELEKIENRLVELGEH